MDGLIADKFRREIRVAGWFPFLLSIPNRAGCGEVMPELSAQPMIRQFALTILASLSSCNVNKPLPPQDFDLSSPNHPARIAQYKADYASKHAAYRCDKSQLPATQIHSVSLREFSSVALSRQLKLRLKLGRRIDQPDAHSYRTESAYVLSSSSGKELGRAESMMIKAGASESTETIKVLFTPFENCVLVEEETLGAGSMIRHVVFIPASSSSKETSKVPAVWRAFHLYLPERDFGVGEGEDVGTVWGISGGKIYVEMDDLFYAFPVDMFVTTSLGVSNG